MSEGNEMASWWIACRKLRQPEMGTDSLVLAAGRHRNGLRRDADSHGYMNPEVIFPCHPEAPALDRLPFGDCPTEMMKTNRRNALYSTWIPGAGIV